VSELGDLLELLDGAADRWTTVHGVVREWRDQTLVNRAFERKHQLPAMRATLVGATPPVSETFARVWFARDRARVERGEHVHVVNGDQWWTFSPEAGAITNARERKTTSGGSEARALLEPAPILGRFDFHVHDAIEVAGRVCLRVTARRRPPAPMEFDYPPFGMISGGDDFELAVDRERGVLLSVTKVVDDEAAEIRAFTEITFDEPIDDSVFHFEPPAGHELVDVKDVYPEPEELPIDEAVRRCPFPLFVPDHVLEGAQFRLQFRAGPRRQPAPTVTMSWQTASRTQGLHITQSVAGTLPVPRLPDTQPRREEHNGRTLEVLDSSHARIVRLERDGTDISISGSVDLATMIRIAANLQPAPTTPPAW